MGINEGYQTVLSLPCSSMKTGSFSIDDGNCSENVSFKMNSRFFNLCRVYSNLLNFLGVDFSRTALTFRERKRDSSSLVYVLHKTCNWAFSRRSRARTVKKCKKRRDARAKLLFCIINLLLF